MVKRKAVYVDEDVHKKLFLLKLKKKKKNINEVIKSFNEIKEMEI